MLTAAGVALPQFLPSGVRAANGQLGANDKIGIGFIAIGRQASDLLRGAALLPETRILGFADVNLKRAREAAARYKADAYQDYRRLLERKDIDAIITATPDHWRALVCIHAAQAGKDIYGEKPMSLTIREGRLMVEAVRKYQRVFQTGSQQRSQRQNIAGCELVRSGAIGKIKRVIACNYPSPWEGDFPAQPVPDELNWDMWCGPNQIVPFNQDLYLPRANPGWISFRPYSGGEVTGWGAHGLDQVQSALGMDESGPIEVWVEGPKFNPPTYTKPESRARGEQTCMAPKVFFRYPGDIIMEFADGPNGGAVFIGEKGKITINRGVCQSEPNEELAENALRKAKDKGGNHIQDWYNCIKSRAKPRADVEIGQRSTTVCHLANIARWAGRKLRWDPVKEIFPDDQQANEYLDRPRRKPWELPKSV